ncbi:unnamed protein product [Linum trigynum]|uniref:Uncharacterized protein n=1 Tax=Linum trigynum TaxID=586398 RepID=A0AAV2EFX3_9ROSI
MICPNIKTLSSIPGRNPQFTFVFFHDPAAASSRGARQPPSLELPFSKAPTAASPPSKLSIFGFKIAKPPPTTLQAR